MDISNFMEIVQAYLRYGMCPRRNIEIGTPEIKHIMN